MRQRKSLIARTWKKVVRLWNQRLIGSRDAFHSSVWLRSGRKLLIGEHLARFFPLVSVHDTTRDFASNWKQRQRFRLIADCSIDPSTFQLLLGAKLIGTNKRATEYISHFFNKVYFLRGSKSDFCTRKNSRSKRSRDLEAWILLRIIYSIVFHLRHFSIRVIRYLFPL